MQFRFIIALMTLVIAVPLEAEDLMPKHIKGEMVGYDIMIEAPIDAVWQAWTTREGIKSFFAPDSLIEIKPGGAYEFWFLPDAAHNQRGSYQTHILGLTERKMLHFTWSMPPYKTSIRPHKTSVILYFDDIGKGTKLRLRHTGWGVGDDWDDGYQYFVNAWAAVLPNLKKVLEAKSPK